MGSEGDLGGAVVVGFLIHGDLVAAEGIAEGGVGGTGKLVVVEWLLAVGEQGLLVELLDVGIH